jgi:hypothetical protein
MGADEMKGRKEGRATADAFYGGSVAQAQRKGGQGVQGRRRVEGGNGEESGGPGRGGDSSGGRHQPSVGGRGWRCCRAIGEGDGARATLARAADRRDRATTESGGQRLGAGGVRGSGAVRRGR